MARVVRSAEQHRYADPILDDQGGRPAHGRARVGGHLGVRGNGAQTLPGLGGFKVALDAIEGLRRQWATELGANGIRVVTLKRGVCPKPSLTPSLGA